MATPVISRPGIAVRPRYAGPLSCGWLCGWDGTIGIRCERGPAT